jgi:hypothetical protein
LRAEQKKPMRFLPAKQSTGFITRHFMLKNTSKKVKLRALLTLQNGKALKFILF